MTAKNMRQELISYPKIVLHEYNRNIARQLAYKKHRRELIKAIKHPRLFAPRVFPRGPKSIFNECKSYHSDSNMANSFYDTYGWFKSYPFNFEKYKTEVKSHEGPWPRKNLLTDTI